MMKTLLLHNVDETLAFAARLAIQALSPAPSPASGRREKKEPSSPNTSGTGEEIHSSSQTTHGNRERTDSPLPLAGEGRGRGLILNLTGELGAGKTTFTRGFLQGLGFQGHVKSPTYTLVEPYELPHISVYHFDLYRLKHPAELLELGLEDYLTTNAICIFEWPEQGAEFMPPPDITCHLSAQGDKRVLEITGHNDAANTLIKELA